MENKIDLALYQKHVDEGYITCRSHPEYPLLIWNYTSKAQYDNYWNEVTMAARGLITELDGKIVGRPFKKFMNREQITEPLPVENFTVTEKLDGSLFIVTMWNDHLITATRGSFESDQAERGRKIIAEKYATFFFSPEHTFLFEILYKSNRVVVDYGDLEDIVLLAIVDTENGREAPIHHAMFEGYFPFPLVKHYDGINDIEALMSVQEKNKEGFVVRFDSGLRVKIKMAEYKRLHAILTKTSSKTVWAALANGYDMSTLFDHVPDEFEGWVRATAKELQEAKDAWVAQVMDEFAKMPVTSDKKTFALAAVKSPLSAALFRLFDHREIDTMAWKMVKPEYSRPFVIDEEA